MLSIQKIISPTDFSDPAREGLLVAVLLAEKFNAEIILVHIVETPSWMAFTYGTPQGVDLPEHVITSLREKTVQTLLTLQSEVIPSNIPSRVIARVGIPADEIICLTKEESADIIVIATHGHSGFHRFIFGSVTERVVRTAACPVLTVRPACTAKGRG